jgi:hypothetical protein
VKAIETRQSLGIFGEQRVARDCACPRCKRSKTLVRLPTNFKCADLICDFCGYLAQVKASKVADVDKLPASIFGAAWGPQNERMAANVYFPLFLVLVAPGAASYAIYYLSADLQEPKMFKPRNKLSETAKRAGWQGFLYDLREVRDRFVRLV